MIKTNDNTQYKQLLDNTEIIYNYENSERLINTLNVITQLMIEMHNNELKNASYIVEYKHKRMSIKVQIFKDGLFEGE